MNPQAVWSAVGLIDSLCLNPFVAVGLVENGIVEALIELISKACNQIFTHKIMETLMKFTTYESVRTAIMKQKTILPQILNFFSLKQRTAGEVISGL